MGIEPIKSLTPKKAEQITSSQYCSAPDRVPRISVFGISVPKQELKELGLVDPDEFVDFLLKKRYLEFDKMSKKEKDALRRDLKLEMIISMNPEVAKADLSNEKTVKALVSDYDATIRGAIYAFKSGKINKLSELSNLSDAEILNVKYEAAKEYKALNPEKDLDFRNKMIIARGDLYKAVAEANDMSAVDLYDDENKYELIYQYLMNKGEENLTEYEKKELEILNKIADDFGGDLKNIKMAQWGEGKFFEDIDDDGILKKTVNKVTGNTVTAKLEKVLTDLSPEEQQEKITELLKDCANLDQYYRMMMALGSLQKKGLVDAETLLNANKEAKASIQAFASLASKEMDAKGQEIVGKEFARQAALKNSPITDKQVRGYMTNIIPEYEVEAQAPTAKAMIDTKRDAAINAAGEMISLLAEEPAKSVYQYVIAEADLTNEQRSIITSNAHYYCGPEGHNNPDRLAQLEQIDSEYHYDPNTGVAFGQNYSEFSPYNNIYSTENDNMFSGNNVTNQIDKSTNQDFLTSFLGNEKDTQEIKEIVAKIQNASSAQEIREAIKDMPEYAFTDMIQANPELLNKFLGTEFESKAKSALLPISYIPKVGNILNEIKNKENNLA